MNKISFILPVYNVEKYLLRCLKSLIPLLELGHEAIIVIDGSTDKSSIIANDFAKNNTNVKVIEQKNKGLSGARNTGIKYANGEYIWFIDSDDFLDLSDCEELLISINSGKYDIISVGRYEDTINKSIRTPILKKKEYPSGISYFKDAMNYGFYRTNAWDKIFRTSLIKNYDLRFIEGRLYEDMLFCQKAIYLSNNVLVLPCYVYHYILYNTTSITNKIRKQDLDVLWYVNELIDLTNQFVENNDLITKEVQQLIFIWVNSCILKKYIPLYDHNPLANDIINKTIENLHFKKAVCYCCFHKTPIKHFFMAWGILLCPKLYYKIVNKLLK